MLQVILLVGAATAIAQFTIEIEGGVAITGYNDVRSPGDSGTFVGLSDELDGSPFPFARGRLSYTFGDRNTVSLLVAPLQTSYKGSLDRPALFEGESWAAGTSLQSTYRFNSYRLTYRYELVNRERFSFGLGLTAKIRDALIRFEGDGRSAEKTDFGFVPLINTLLVWEAAPGFSLQLEADALAAPQGRAADARLAAAWQLSERFSLLAGYRILEGGADNDEVYTFSLFHYGLVSLKIRP